MVKRNAPTFWKVNIFLSTKHLINLYKLSYFLTVIHYNPAIRLSRSASLFLRENYGVICVAKRDDFVFFIRCSPIIIVCLHICIHCPFISIY